MTLRQEWLQTLQWMWLIYANRRYRAQKRQPLGWLDSIVKSHLTITPAGTLKIKGGKLKIVGDNPLVGVFFQNETASLTYQVPENDIIVNNPAELIIQIPTLTAGTYKLVIRNQFAVGKLLKEPRATVFDKILTVAP